ncbi:MAG: hypothetical protein UU47_C0012G0002 [candidate division TM6 bacterium GW2011_GWE2_41_16]|nr:MAG: hypothetical protein UU47_C0012G0002 [candidate division TM6 bacterium GW2011_GWE2_41_16]
MKKIIGIIAIIVAMCLPVRAMQTYQQQRHTMHQRGGKNKATLHNQAKRTELARAAEANRKFVQRQSCTCAMPTIKVGSAFVLIAALMLLSVVPVNGIRVSDKQIQEAYEDRARQLRDGEWLQKHFDLCGCPQSRHRSVLESLADHLLLSKNQLIIKRCTCDPVSAKRLPFESSVSQIQPFLKMTCEEICEEMVAPKEDPNARDY